jgi:hypothetical protein
VLETAASRSLVWECPARPCVNPSGRSLDKIKCARPALALPVPPAPLLGCTSLLPITSLFFVCPNTLFHTDYFLNPLSDRSPDCSVHVRHVGARADPGLTRGMVAQVHRREYGSHSSHLEAPAVGRTMRLPYGTLLAQTIGDLPVQLP